MFIQTEATPNPATLKFLPGRAVLETGTLDMREQGAAAQSPLAAAAVRDSERRRRVLRLRLHLRHQARRRMAAAQAGDPRRHHGALHVSGAPLLASGGEPAATADADEFFDAEDAETVATIKDLIETRVRPAVANDGGDITFKGFKEGIVYLHHEGRLLGLPVLDRDAAARHPEPAQAFRARRGRSAAGVT